MISKLKSAAKTTAQTLGRVGTKINDIRSRVAEAERAFGAYLAKHLSPKQSKGAIYSLGGLLFVPELALFSQSMEKIVLSQPVVTRYLSGFLLQTDGQGLVTTLACDSGLQLPVILGALFYGNAIRITIAGTSQAQSGAQNQYSKSSTDKNQGEQQMKNGALMVFLAWAIPTIAFIFLGWWVGDFGCLLPNMGVFGQ